MASLKTNKQGSLKIHLTEPEKAEAEGQACSNKTAQDSKVELPVSGKVKHVHRHTNTNSHVQTHIQTHTQAYTCTYPHTFKIQSFSMNSDVLHLASYMVFR